MSKIIEYLRDNPDIIIAFLSMLSFIFVVLFIMVAVKFKRMSVKLELDECNLLRVSEVLKMQQGTVDSLVDHKHDASYKIRNLYRDREDFSNRLRQIEIQLYDLPDDLK